MQAALKEVIMERFNAMVPPTTTTPPSDDAAIKDERTVKKTNTNGVKKVKSEESQDSSDDLSEVEAKPAKKKQRKSQDSDAKLAAMLQAQENSRARPSRAGTTKKVPVKRKPKKKSAAKIKGDDDSDVGLNSDGEKKVVNRTGGFHVGDKFHLELEYVLMHSRKNTICQKPWHSLSEKPR
jgi:upstream activation factor subunit UAF30